MSAFLSLDDITFGYPGVSVFSGLSASLLRGRSLGLLGTSGSGKTTLLRLIAGLDQPATGTVRFAEDRPIVTLVSQDPVVFEHYSRYENATYRRFRGAYKDKFETARFERLTRILSLDRGFLDHCRPLTGMSGGQRQRMILLRELSVKPDLILLDEPCTGLDTAVKREFLLLLSELLEHLGTRCVYATHHFEELRLLVADEIVYLHSDGGRSWGTSQTLAEFRAEPPTVEAAVTALGTLTTVLEGGMTRSGEDAWFSPAESGGTAMRLVLPTQTVTARDDGFPCEVVASSGEVVVARMLGQHVVVPSGSTPRGIGFNGDAYAFPDGGSGRRVHVETLEEKPGCKLIRIRS